jgi:hypothetical protein
MKTWPDVDSSLKLCMNCTHSKKQAGLYQCRHPKSDGWKPNLVDGSSMINYSSSWKGYCENCRETGTCGPAGKFFEAKVVVPRPSILQMIKNIWKNDAPTGGC